MQIFFLYFAGGGKMAINYHKKTKTPACKPKGKR